MSPWRMMNEWGIPSVEIWTLTYKYADILATKGEYVASIAFAGRITLEDQIFKALALGAPHVKTVGMERVQLTVAIASKEENLPVYYSRS